MTISSAPPTASPDPPVDLEKGAAGRLKAAAATEEEEEGLAVVDPGKARCINAALDATLAVYSLSLVGVTVWMFKVSDDWRGPLQAALFFFQLALLTYCLNQMVKESCVRRYATRRRSSTLLVNDGADLGANLLAAPEEYPSTQ